MIKFNEKLFRKTPIIGILRGYDKETILNITKVYVNAGFSNIEITKNTKDAFDIISSLVSEYGNQLNIGCGTILTKKEVKKAMKAGANFIVTPIVVKKVICYCVKRGIPVFPGAFSPTEIYNAWKYGAKMVKVFPSANMNTNYIKNISAPLDFIDMMPTGGVSLENILEFKNSGAKAYGMGGLLFDPEMIENKDWEGLYNHFIKFKQILKN